MGLCLKCGYESDEPFKDGCPKCGYNPMKEYVAGIEKAIEELWSIFEKQNHSGNSAYFTVMGFLEKYFKTNWHPSWIISQSPAILTIGGPQELKIYPLNKEAKKLKLSVAIKS